MNQRVMRSMTGVVLFFTFYPCMALGIACPGSGAKIKVIIDNPTNATGQQVTISGHTANATCTTKPATYSETVTLYQANGANEFIVPGSSGLRTGVWVHRVQTNAGQDQRLKKMILYASASSDYTEVRWTLYPFVVRVNGTGDGSPATPLCGLTCTFRQALARANDLALTAPATLVQFNVSPGTMTRSESLVVGASVGGESTTGPITIDATDASGDPFIVGDPFAADQGNQGPFTRTVDLAGTTRIVVAGDDVTIRGLEIKNTTAGTPSKVLISSAMTNTRLESLRLDGGATGDCPDCDIPGSLGNADAHLVKLSGASPVLWNLEGHSAYGIGVDADSSTGDDIRNSWLHHNYVTNVFGDEMAISDSTLERAGQRLSDGQVVFMYAAGLVGNGLFEIVTTKNVIRNNRAEGIQAGAAFIGNEIDGDYVCGNGAAGIAVSEFSGSPFVSATGITAAYNSSHGVKISGFLPWTTLDFNDQSAFTANNLCGFKNDSGVTASALNNQWRGATTSCSQSPDVCPGSEVNCDPIQDPATVVFGIDMTVPTSPSDAVLKGQSFRVNGVGFNAIEGNPLASAAGCTIGYGGGASNCCRMANKANECDLTGSVPVLGGSGGNCVAVRDGVGVWRAIEVNGVTPTTLTSAGTQNVLVCLGESNEMVRVIKKDRFGQGVFVQESYCTEIDQF